MRYRLTPPSRPTPQPLIRPSDTAAPVRCRTNNKCDAAVQKLVGKYVAAITGCYAKSAGKLGTAPMGINVDPLCISKADGKLSVGIGKAELKPPCTGAIPQYAGLKSAADAFLDAHTCSLDPTNPGCTPPAVCGDGINSPSEACDASAPSAGWAQCGPDFTCTACNCACPTKVEFAGTATDPLSILDTGWTGISHRAPIISNGDVTVNVSCARVQPSVWRLRHQRSGHERGRRRRAARQPSVQPRPVDQVHQRSDLRRRQHLRVLLRLVPAAGGRWRHQLRAESVQRIRHGYRQHRER